MASPNGKSQGGTETELTQAQPQQAAKPGFWDRLRFAFTGQGGKPEWFGPGAPLPPVAPPGSPAGRAFDYSFGWNLGFQPRGEVGESQISFTVLRRMAEPALGGFDLMRIAIETRKDQLSSSNWKIKARDPALGDGGARARAIESVLRRPDGYNTFADWQRMIIEDMLVLDAPAIYLRRVRGKVKLPPLPKPEAEGESDPGSGDESPGAEGASDAGAGRPGAEPEGQPGGKKDDEEAAGADGDEPRADDQEDGKDGDAEGSGDAPPGADSKAKEGDDEAPPAEGKDAGEGEDEPAEEPPAERGEGADGEEPPGADDGERGAPGEPKGGESATPQKPVDGEGATPKGTKIALKPTYRYDKAEDVGVLLEVVDGATIKPLLSVDGRRPLPPAMAYVQSIKGMPAFEYTSEELVYRPRNVRSHRGYGFSPVEQIITTIDIALKRQLSQLEYYTAGSVPDMMIGTPETWTVEQLRELQAWFDSLLVGDTAERRKVRFVPGGSTAIPLKDPKLKDEWDEWLARLVCWAFSLSPQALVKELNRSTSETMQEVSKDEGLEPFRKWFKDTMDLMLEVAFESPELEFAWSDEEISDPKTKMEVWTGLSSAQVVTRNEVREAYGLQPVEGGDKFSSPAPAGPPGFPGAGGPPGAHGNGPHPVPPFGGGPGGGERGDGVDGPPKPPPRPASAPPPPFGAREKAARPDGSKKKPSSRLPASVRQSSWRRP